MKSWAWGMGFLPCRGDPIGRSYGDLKFGVRIAHTAIFNERLIDNFSSEFHLA